MTTATVPATAPATPGRTKPMKLAPRGVAAVAAVVAGLVVAATHGYAGYAALIGYGLYMLVSGGVARVADILPTPSQVLRGLCWCVAGIALVASVHGSTAPGGATLGLALVAATCTALKLTKK